MMRVFAVLARFKGLRGTMLDPFGYTQERRRERGLIERYEQVASSLIDDLDHTNHAVAVEIASLPDRIRGFGHVKSRSIEEARAPRSRAAGAVQGCGRITGCGVTAGAFLMHYAKQNWCYRSAPYVLAKNPFKFD